MPSLSCMHVDGGTTAVFFLPMTAILENYTRGKVSLRVRRHLYVIRNKVAPEWEPVEDNTLAIVGRSLSTVIKNQGIGDLYRLYVEARNQKLDFNYGAIPPDFVMASKDATSLVGMATNGRRRRPASAVWLIILLNLHSQLFRVFFQLTGH